LAGTKERVTVTLSLVSLAAHYSLLSTLLYLPKEQEKVHRNNN